MQDILPLKQTVRRRLDSFCRELNLFRAFVFHDWDVNFTGQVLAVKLETFGHFAIFYPFYLGKFVSIWLPAIFSKNGLVSPLVPEFDRASWGPLIVQELERCVRNLKGLHLEAPRKTRVLLWLLLKQGFVGLVGWLVGWLGLVGWLVGLFVCWLVGWLIGWLVDWLIGWFDLLLVAFGRGHLMKWWSWKQSNPLTSFVYLIVFGPSEKCGLG